MEAVHFPYRLKMHRFAYVTYILIQILLSTAESTCNTTCSIVPVNAEILVKKLKRLLESDSGVNIIEYDFTVQNRTSGIQGRWYRTHKAGSSHLIYVYEYFKKITSGILTFPMTKINVPIDIDPPDCLVNMTEDDQNQFMSQYLLQDFNVTSAGHNHKDIVYICNVKVEKSLSFLLNLFQYRCYYTDDDPEIESVEIYKDVWIRGLKLMITFSTAALITYYGYLLLRGISKQSVIEMKTSLPGQNFKESELEVMNSKLLYMEKGSLKGTDFFLFDNIKYLINNNDWFETYWCVRYAIQICMYFSEILPLFFPSILFVVENRGWAEWLILIISFFAAVSFRLLVNRIKSDTENRWKQCLNFYILGVITGVCFFSMLCVVPFVILASVLATIDTEQQGRGVIILVPIFAMYARSTFSGINDKYAKFLDEIIKRIQLNLRLESGVSGESGVNVKPKSEVVMFYNTKKRPCVLKDFFFYCCSLEHPSAPGSIFKSYSKALLEIVAFAFFLLLVFFLMMSYTVVYTVAPINQTTITFLTCSLPLIAKTLFRKEDYFEVNYESYLEELCKPDQMNKFYARKTNKLHGSTRCKCCTRCTWCIWSTCSTCCARSSVTEETRLIQMA